VRDDPGERASTEGMKAGGYYDLHSEYQRRVVEGGEHLIRSATAALDLRTIAGALTVVDYGAGTGATSVQAMLTAVAEVRQRDRDHPVVAVHNDVVTNDFSQLFRNIAAPGGYLALPGGPIYPSAVAGSFFNQVVPSGTVHLAMCSNAAHWLREQPDVRVEGGMYFDAHEAAGARLAEQAAGDWLAFLGSRAAELAAGGRLVVQGIATSRSDDGTDRVSASRLLRTMWQVADELADEGLLARDVLERYVFPVYCRSLEESLAPVRSGGPLAGAFEVVSHAVDEVPSPYWEAFRRDGDAAAYAESYVQFVRAFAESTMMKHLFRPGAAGVDPPALCETFFDRLRAATAADPEAGRYEAWVLRLLFARR
jgi:S-adenosylmethionine-dependent carboxyl methyltransferase